MKYIKTILTMVLMLVLLSTGINAYGPGDYPVYTGKVIDGTKYMNKEELKLDSNSIKIYQPYTTLIQQPLTTKEFYVYGLQITNLKLSPSQIIGGKTVTVSFDVFNNQLSPVYTANAKVTVKGMTLTNQKYIGTVQKSEKKHVELGLTLPLCANGAEVVDLHDVVVEVSYTAEINGKTQYLTKETQLKVYNDLSCNQPIVVEPKTDPVVTIKASNEAPVAGDSVSFSAEFTKGTPTDFVYNWDFNGDNLVDSSKVTDSYTYATAGTYTVTLTLKDTTNNMKETKVTKQIIVSEKANPQDAAPEFTILVVTANPKVNEQVLFNVAFTKGVPAEYTYNWDFNGDGLVDPTGFPPAYTYTQAGTYTITLTISKAGKQYVAVKQIIVADAAGNPVNTAPVVDFTFAPANPVVNTAVQFTATASDAQNDALTYAWDFNKDNVIDSTISNPSDTFASTGNYDVVLTVSDGKLSTIVKKTVTVAAAAPGPQTEQQKYNDLENKFEEYEDDYVDLKDDYETALKANDEDELDDVKDELDDLYKDIKKLNNDIDDFQAIVQDEDVKDDLKQLEKDVKDLKQKVLDLKNGNKDESILNPSSVSSSQQPQQFTYVPQTQPTLPQTTVEVITTPNMPSQPTFVSQSQPKDSTVKIALIIAGLVVLLALIIFMVAVIFTKF
ncbi:PKD domain-containing protein [Candidatus Woesearchaeota archaeon]|nr:PKD domain-containing protein [Candidatus Woesearchaeota archaeon]